MSCKGRSVNGFPTHGARVSKKQEIHSSPFLVDHLLHLWRYTRFTHWCKEKKGDAYRLQV